MKDIITSVHGEGTPEIKILDHGYVRLVDCMPRLVPDDQTCDQAIVQAARVSYGDGTKQVSEDRGLIRYLMRHTHTTPFEMVEFKYHIKMPIFVCRQLIRHRTANVNEISGRYSIMKDEFFLPSAHDIRRQSKNNKQGSDGQIESGDAAFFSARVEELCTEAYQAYEEAIASGVGKEQARILLPVNLYTEFYWKCDLHNIFHFLSLRCDAHAQYEIRVFADAMLALIKPLVPWAVEAWDDYHPYRGAVKLSRLEWDVMKGLISQFKDVCPDLEPKLFALNSGNKREDAEWEEKLKKLFE